MDDVTIFSKSLDKHVKHLKAVFDQLRKAGLLLNCCKCEMVCDEVEYSCHVFTKDEPKPNNHNVEELSSSYQLQQFFGLTLYHCHFVPD